MKIMGIDLDHFRFDSDNADACTDFAEAYGSEPEQINVFFPWPTVAKKILAWKRHTPQARFNTAANGGRRASCGWTRTASTAQTPNPAPGNCKEWDISVIIAELGQFAFVTVLTHSINDIMEFARRPQSVPSFLAASCAACRSYCDASSAEVGARPDGKHVHQGEVADAPKTKPSGRGSNWPAWKWTRSRQTCAPPCLPR